MSFRSALLNLINAFTALNRGPAVRLRAPPGAGADAGCHDLPFMRLMAGYGGPDVYYTEYFRVHATSTLERGFSIPSRRTRRPP